MGLTFYNNDQFLFLNIQILIDDQDNEFLIFILSVNVPNILLLQIFFLA